MRRKKGQSILEYVLVFTIIVVAIALAANNVLKPAIDGAINGTSTLITNATSKFAP